jgi:hypothetical protein
MTIVYACRHVSRQGPVEPVVHRRMRCPRCRGKKKKPRAVTTIFLSLLCLLALATSAAAECAWVLWQRDDSFDSRGALVSSPTGRHRDRYGEVANMASLEPELTGDQLTQAVTVGLCGHTTSLPRPQSARRSPHPFRHLCPLPRWRRPPLRRPHPLRLR